MRRDFVGFCVCLCTVVSVGIAGFSATPHVPQAAEGVATASIVTPQPLVQASVYEPFSSPATQPLFIMQSTGVTEEELNQRLTGLLYHMRWLMDERQSEHTAGVVEDASLGDQVNRLERQMFRYMDESHDDRSDLSDNLTTDGAFLTPTLTDATLNGTTTAAAIAAAGNLTTTGRLGVGTTSPADRLAVAGAIYLAETTPTDGSSRLYNQAGSLYWNGSLVASSTTGNWSGSGGNVYRSSGNVGIGTTTPSSILHLNGGTGSLSTGLSFGDGDTGLFEGIDDSLYFQRNGIPRWILDSNGFGSSNNAGPMLTEGGTPASPTRPSFRRRGDDDTGIYIVTEDELGITTGGVSRMLFDAAGNVGIGTTSPNYKLSVTGDINATGTYRVNGTALALTHLADAANDGNNLFLGGAGFSGVNGVDYFNDYNVGIGPGSFDNPNTDAGQTYFGDNNTAVGYESLTVNTTGHSNTGLGSNSLANVTTGHNNAALGYRSLAKLVFGNRNSAVGSYALSNNREGSYNVAIGYQAGNFLTDGSSQASTTDQSIFIGALTEALTASDQNSIVIGYGAEGLGSNTVVLGNDSILTTALKGNVGIGTTSPLAKLHVSGGNILLDNNRSLAFLDSNGSAENVLGLSTGNITTLTSSDGANAIWLRNNDTIEFKTGNTERMSIESNGNVGIGTDSPSAPLTVVSDVANDFRSAIILTSTTTDDAAKGARFGTLHYDTDEKPFYGIFQQSTGAINQLSMGGGTSLGNAATRISLYTASSPTTLTGTERLTITGAGRVGIGTTSPAFTLSASGTVGFANLTSSTGAGSLCLSSNNEVVYNSGSDACLPSLRATKYDIEALDFAALEVVTALEAVSFVYNQGDGRTRYGFIAEDVADVDELLATYNADGELSGIDDRSMIAVLVMGVQELWGKVTALIAKDKELEATDAELRAEIETLKAQNEAMAEILENLTGESIPAPEVEEVEEESEPAPETEDEEETEDAAPQEEIEEPEPTVEESEEAETASDRDDATKEDETEEVIEQTEELTETEEEPSEETEEPIELEEDELVKEPEEVLQEEVVPSGAFDE